MLTVTDNIPSVLNFKFYCLVYKSALLTLPVFSQINPNNDLTPFTLNINYNLIVIFPSTFRLHKLSFIFRYEDSGVI